jgi:hypothetical protein
MKENGAVHISLDADLMEREIAAEASKEGLTADEYLDKYYGSSSDDISGFMGPDYTPPNQPDPLFSEMYYIKKAPAAQGDQ